MNRLLDDPVLQLALANLLRDRRRTLLPGCAAMIALLLLWSLNDTMQDSLTENFQDSLVGSIQVHGRDFFRHPRLDNDIGSGREVAGVLERLGVQRWTPRLEAYGLAAGPRASTGMMLIALDPERERRVTRLARQTGSGRFLEPDDGNVCLLGRGAARNLGVRVGDSVDLISHDRFGAPVGERFEVVGILDNGGFGIDRSIVFLPLSAAQSLLEMPGRITDLVVRVPGNRIGEVSAALRRQLDSRRYEVLRWDEMFPVLAEWVSLQRGFEQFFLLVVLLLVAAAVSNVALVASLGRRREFAVMLALGNRRRDLGRLLLLESAFLGLLGSSVGLLLGWPLVSALGRHGIDLSYWLGETGRYYLEPILHPSVDPGNALLLALAVWLITVLAALYPAWRAGRTETTQVLAARA